MKNTKKAFTLVELIVVITILAVLGTIAFVSFGSYSADARNTKRTSDIKGIQSKISTQTTEGASVFNLVTAVAGSTLASPSIQGTGATTSEYTAGTPNYAALGMKAEDFKDPSTETDYIIGATTKLSGKFEVTTSLEDGAGNKVAKVVGDYSPRTAETITFASNTDKTAKLAPADIGKLKVGDMAGTKKVVKISNDLVTVTFNEAAGSSFALLAEVGGLVDATSSVSGTVVVDGSTTALPY